MKVFISRSHADAPLAGRVSEGLRREGLDVCDPALDHLPGDNWAANVGRALEESEAMVVLLTPAAVDSPHVMREIEYALGAQNYSNRLVPVVVGDPERVSAENIPWIVRGMRWVYLDDREAGVPDVRPIADAIRSHAQRRERPGPRDPKKSPTLPLNTGSST